MTRDEAIQIGIESLAKWHVHDHGDGCACAESKQFKSRSAAVIDALIADGIMLMGTNHREDARTASASFIDA